MCMSIKKKIKNLLPDKVIYSYDVIKTVPKYLKSYVENRNIEFSDIKFYTDKQTVDEIIINKKSLSRFGDGEFMWMTGNRLDSYQDYSVDFAKDLVRAFQNDNKNLLVGIPYGIFNSDGCNLQAKMHWSIIKSSFYSKLEKFVDFNRTYSNASITRPYIDYKDYDFSTKAFKNLQRIWDKKDIVIVEGEKTKLGIGNDLFCNANSVSRIICPATNAYEKLSEIELAIENNVNKSQIMLAALGPTASILASDMCDKGYQVIDIGHIDIEYSWYLNHSILRDVVPGKYVNESGEKDCSSIYDDDADYNNSIICKIL